MVGKIGISLGIAFILLAGSCKKDIGVEEVQTETFVKLFGGSPIDFARDIVVTDEYVGVTGAMNTLDKGMQAFFICTDKYGNELSWSPVLIGDGLNDAGNAIFRAADGDFIIVGTKSITGINTDLLVTKVSVSGSVLWSYTFGGAGKEEGWFGMELSSGGYVVGGYTESSGNGLKDIYLLKLDVNGSEVWVNPSTIGAQNNEIGYDIAELNGSVFVIGSTESYGAAIRKVYVVQVDPSNGKGIYYNLFGTATAYQGIKICNLPNNRLLIMGSNGSNATYLNSIGSDLTTSYWEKEFISTAGEHYNDMFFSQNQLLLCGSSFMNQHADIYIRWLDQSAGNDIGSLLIPSAGEQILTSGCMGSDGKLFVAGSNTVNGLSQIFLIKKDL